MLDTLSDYTYVRPVPGLIVGEPWPLISSDVFGRAPHYEDFPALLEMYSERYAWASRDVSAAIQYAGRAEYAPVLSTRTNCYSSYKKLMVDVGTEDGIGKWIIRGWIPGGPVDPEWHMPQAEWTAQEEGTGDRMGPLRETMRPKFQTVDYMSALYAPWKEGEEVSVQWARRPYELSTMEMMCDDLDSCKRWLLESNTYGPFVISDFESWAQSGQADGIPDALFGPVCGNGRSYYKDNRLTATQDEWYTPTFSERCQYETDKQTGREVLKTHTYAGINPLSFWVKQPFFVNAKNGETWWRPSQGIVLVHWSAIGDYFIRPEEGGEGEGGRATIQFWTQSVVGYNIFQQRLGPFEGRFTMTVNNCLAEWNLRGRAVARNWFGQRFPNFFEEIYHINAQLNDVVYITGEVQHNARVAPMQSGL